MKPIFIVLVQLNDVCGRVMGEDEEREINKERKGKAVTKERKIKTTKGEELKHE